ncbi:hypothetical protein ACGFNU_42310 [Spirillospora sp. NPDC048911]
MSRLVRTATVTGLAVGALGMLPASATAAATADGVTPDASASNASGVGGL